MLRGQGQIFSLRAKAEARVLASRPGDSKMLASTPRLDGRCQDGGLGWVILLGQGKILASSRIAPEVIVLWSKRRCGINFIFLHTV